jgi:hypothetical protein
VASVDRTVPELLRTCTLRVSTAVDESSDVSTWTQ